MRKFLSLFLALLSIPALAISFSPAAAYDLRTNQHRAMHEILMVDRGADGKMHGGLCTAYAIGPHTLMTAEHCNDPKTDKVYIDPEDRAAVEDDSAPSYGVTARIFDRQDHMLLDITGIVFVDTIPLSSSVRLPVQGEHTYTWGNPAGRRDQYREGVVTGNIPYDGDGDVDAQGPTLYLVQTATIGGDSGSAVFSAVDGQLIGIITFRVDGGFMGMFPIQFTDEQILESRQ